jgi:pilus assembly protein CpaE
MLLFSETGDKNKAPASSAIVATADPEMMEKISEQLLLRSVENIIRCPYSLDNLDQFSFEGNPDYFIVDVQNKTDAKAVSDALFLHASRGAVKVAFGKNDSILLMEAFIKQDIFYLYYPNQLNNLGSIINNEHKLFTSSREPVKIAVVGCKGGVGASSLSYHIAGEIARRRESGTLLVQGCGGSRNLDMIAKTAITHEVAKLQPHLFAISEDPEEKYHYGNPLFSNYDHIIFDFSGYNAVDEQIEAILTHSDCILLVCDRDLSSVRMAKKLIESNQHLQSDSSGVKRLFLCFNQHYPKVNGAISPEEVNGLAGKNVDITIPFISVAGDPALLLNFNGKHKKTLDALIDLLLGKKGGADKPKNNRSLLDSLFRKS